MFDYSPTKTQKLPGNPDKSDNPTASSPACAGLAGDQSTVFETPDIHGFNQEQLERDICSNICHMTQHAHQMSEVKFEKSMSIDLLVASVIINKTEYEALGTTQTMWSLLGIK